MNSTPNEQRTDVLTTGGDQKDMQDLKGEQIKQVAEQNDGEHEGEEVDPQISVPADMPKQ
ncbi:MAG: hypothetical protein ABWY27_12900 [Telluria sp.]